MIVIVLDRAPEKLRGELTRWLLETKPGVFVGKVSTVVRGKLWERVTACESKTGAIILYSADTEQGFCMEMCGEPTRTVIDLEGIYLIKVT